jgi:Na+/proline symporter/nitrogen-specific signal transduction histidine kinase
MDGIWILLASLAYLGVLFGIAWFGDRRAESGRSIIRNPVIYTLSIAVYCTSWTFYGAVGSAARSGPEFVTIYLGPTITFVGWWFVLRRMVRISKAHRITSIADFISSRYGKSSRLSVLVTLVAAAGAMPYLALQLKAVATSFTVLAGLHGITGGPAPQPITVVTDTAFWIAIGMAIFAILFGTRHLDAAEHHEGVVAAIAFESLVKLLAFVAVGVFVVWGLHEGFADLFNNAAQLPNAMELMTISGSNGPWIWLTTTALSMCAVVCLPRQFQVTVVENVDERHLSTAAWLFPLYLLVISIFVLPIALSGLLLLPPDADADSYVLTLPLLHGHPILALLAFLGGLSSATGMVIVATITLSTMVTNDLLMPFLLRLRVLRLTEKGDLTGLLLFIRRASICTILALGYITYRLTAQSGALASIGLISFAATAQFAPAVLGGLFWKRANRNGAKLGLLLGFAAWVYMLLLPSFARSGWLDPSFVEFGPWGLVMLKPEAFLGLDGLDSLTHALFWSMGLNLGGFVIASLLGQQGALDRIQAALFVDVFRRPGGESGQVWRRTATVADLYVLAQRFLGRSTAYRAFHDHPDIAGRGGRLVTSRQLTSRSFGEATPELVHMTERLLSGTIGAASARVMVASVAKGEMVGLDQVMKILEETSQVIEYSQNLEQKSAELEATTAELREANQRLKELDRLKDDFLSTVSHELRTPLTSIRSFSEILADNPDLERAQVDHFLGIIIRESERLTRLIDQILDLARLEAGHGEWSMGRIDGRDSLADAAAVTASLFQEKGVALSTNVGASPAVIFADRDRLVQVFVNLLSNAVKFAPKGSGKVTVEAHIADGQWWVRVTDNGPGVPPDQQAQVFDKFVQASNTTRASQASPNSLGDRPAGSGLGLAISRQIIDHFQGRIWIEDAPHPPGASACLALPCFSSEGPGTDQGRSGGANLPDAAQSPLHF